MIKSGYFNQVYRDIIADNAALPSLPDVAHRIRRAMQDDDHDFETIARIVQTDVGVTASLIRMANSPLYYRRQPAMDVRAAIGRLGMAGTRDYVTICAMRGMYEARTTAVRALMKSLWEQSSELAALSAVLASLSRHFAPDTAMLAGLLQDVGALPLLWRIDQSARGPVEPDEVHEAVAQFAPKIGAVLMAHWNFGPEMVDVARIRDPDRRVDTEPAGQPSLAELVQAARIHMSIRFSARSDAVPPDTSALARLNLGDVTPEGKLSMLIEAKTEVIRIQQMMAA